LPGLSDLQHGRPSLSQIARRAHRGLLGAPAGRARHGRDARLPGDQRRHGDRRGRSIGSELARQIADFGPAELVLLDHAENGLYFVHNEVGALHAELELHAIVCEIRDLEGVKPRVRPVSGRSRVSRRGAQHVPRSRPTPREAVLNNIVGTRNLVDAADRVGVTRFVLISTDKAVNPIA